MWVRIDGQLVEVCRALVTFWICQYIIMTNAAEDLSDVTPAAIIRKVV